MSRSNSRTQRRQSDLQPVYDLLDALHPAHLKDQFNSLSHRTRWIIITTAAVIALMWSALMLVQAMVQHVHSTTGPFLLDAIVSPYGLEGRLVPALGGDLDLPTTVGDFNRIGDVVTLSPDIKQPVESASAETAAGDEDAVSAPIRSATAECLLTAASDSTDVVNCITFRALYAASTDYKIADGSTLNVTAARFPTEETATEATYSLYEQAGSQGKTGNFAIGVLPVDYFASSGNGLYSFTWSNSVWVYTVAAASYDQMEAFVKAFPY
ncbi:MAG: hypothetical protein R3E39_07015 [Anaerolineae bacterium]